MNNSQDDAIMKAAEDIRLECDDGSESYSGRCSIPSRSEMEALIRARVAPIFDQLNARIAELEAKVEELSTPKYYWDNRELECSYTFDELGEMDEPGDVFEIRPIHELPKKWVLVKREGVELFDTESKANEAADKLFNQNKET